MFQLLLMHLEVLREHKGGDCISTGKKVCVCVCVCVCAQQHSEESVGQRETASPRRRLCHRIKVPVLFVPRRSSECY